MPGRHVACAALLTCIGVAACGTSRLPPSPAPPLASASAQASASGVSRWELRIAPLERHLVLPVVEGESRSPGGKSIASRASVLPGPGTGLSVRGARTAFEHDATMLDWIGEDVVAHTLPGGGVHALDLVTGRERRLADAAGVRGGREHALLWASGEAMRVVDARTGRLVRRLDFAADDVQARPGGGLVAMNATAARILDGGLEVVQELEGTAFSVGPKGEVTMGFVRDGKLRIRLVDRDRTVESPPVNTRARAFDVPPRRAGRHVFAASGTQLVSWDIESGRTSHGVMPAPGNPIVPTDDGRHLCFPFQTTVIDARTLGAARRGLRCVTRWAAEGPMTHEALDLGARAEKLGFVFTSGGDQTVGLAVGRTLVVQEVVAGRTEVVLLSLPELKELHRAPWSTPVLDVLTPTVVLLAGHPARVLELVPPFRSADLLDAHRVGAHVVEGREGRVDLRTFERTPKPLVSEGIVQLGGRRALLASGRLVDLDSGTTRPRPPGPCMRALRRDGALAELDCGGEGLRLALPDGAVRELRRPAEPVAWLAFTTRGRLVVGTAGTLSLFRDDGTERRVGADASPLVDDQHLLVASVTAGVVEVPLDAPAPPRVFVTASPDGRSYVTHERIRGPNGATLVELAEPPSAAAYSADGTVVATASSQRVRIHDAGTGAVLWSFVSAVRDPRFVSVGRDTLVVASAVAAEIVSLRDGEAATVVLEEDQSLLRLDARGVTGFDGNARPDAASRLLCRKRGERRGGWVPCP